MIDSNRKRSFVETGLESRNPAPRPKIMSAIASVSKSLTNEDELEKSTQKTANDRNKDEESKVNEAYTKPEAVKRNRRMFGALMGHLDLAKKKLEQDSNKIDQQNRLKSIAMEKNQLEAKRVQQLQRINQRIEKDKELTARERERAEWQKSQSSDVLSVWKASTSPLAGYLMTSEANLPQLAWLPASHNDITLALLEDRKREVAALILDQECKYEEMERKIDETISANEARRAREASEMLTKYQDGGDVGGHLNSVVDDSTDAADTSLLQYEEEVTDIFGDEQQLITSRAVAAVNNEGAESMEATEDSVQQQEENRDPSEEEADNDMIPAL